MEFQIGDLVQFKADTSPEQVGNFNRPFTILSIVSERHGQKRELRCRIVAADSILTVDPSAIEPYLRS